LGLITSFLPVRDTFGIAASAGVSLSSLPGVNDLSFVQRHFNGENWMDGDGVALPPSSSAELGRNEDSPQSLVPQLGTIEMVQCAGPEMGWSG
jgi:hypothetical protein